ncbi:MAG: ABC transporter ATP-binding protein [Acidimicrobiales bacterium]
MAERLVLEGVTKVFPNHAVALDSVSLEVPAGSFVVLLGPSGSGKTTLLRAVAGIERISAGRISIGAKVVADAKLHVASERRGLSMVFQDYALWPHLSVLENVAFALRRYGESPSRRRTRAAEMIERVGLGRLAERFPGQLSGGEQQRVALARALVGGVGLVLCDEPLSNLDADLRERMRLEISTLVREAGATAVYITHDQSEAFALADQVGVLETGHLVQMGLPEDVYAQPATPFVARFTGAATEVRVRVRQPVKQGADVVVEPLGLEWSRPIPARAIQPLPVGDALLLVRPAAVSLCPVSGDGCHAVGSVRDVAFRGRGYELAVDLNGGGRVSNVASNVRFTRGETVGLRFDKAGCVVFADEGASQAFPGEDGAGQPVLGGRGEPAGQYLSAVTKNGARP